MIPQSWEYIKNNELYTLNRWIIWYENFISIKMLKILREIISKLPFKGEVNKNVFLGIQGVHNFISQAAFPDDMSPE